MSYLQFQVDPREAAYGRLVSGVLGVLRRAVATRVAADISKAEIALDAHLSAGHLSRILNGNVRNITLRTVSDLLWATKHDPRDFEADAFELLSENGFGEYVALDAPKSKLVAPSAISTSGTIIDLTPKNRSVATVESAACQ